MPGEPAAEATIQQPGLSARETAVLNCLRAVGGEASVVQLSLAYAERLYERPATAIAPETRRRLYTEFQQSTLQSLQRRGVISYSHTDGTVRVCEEPETLG